MGLVKKLGLPQDVCDGMPVITAIGYRQVHIENFKSIIEYSRVRIKMLTKTGTVTVNGQRLNIVYYNNEDIHIEGVISSIEL